MKATAAKKAEKPAMGRPEHQPTDKERLQVKMLAAMGIAMEDIAKVVRISEPTLRKHYSAEIEVGHIEANAKVAGALFKQATDQTKPNVTAAIFWLKTRAGWREEEGPRAPRLPAPEPLGKKAQADAGAVIAQVGTDWETLLTPSAPLQ